MTGRMAVWEPCNTPASLFSVGSSLVFLARQWPGMYAGRVYRVVGWLAMGRQALWVVVSESQSWGNFCPAQIRSIWKVVCRPWLPIIPKVTRCFETVGAFVLSSRPFFFSLPNRIMAGGVLAGTGLGDLYICVPPPLPQQSKTKIVHLSSTSPLDRNCCWLVGFLCVPIPPSYRMITLFFLSLSVSVSVCVLTQLA